jgi:hypothetical protein
MLADRVLHTSTTTGTGTYDLIDPPSGQYLSAVASVGSGNRLTYLAQMDGVWEIGWGVVTAGSPATLTRDLIRSSTGALINWAAGTKTISSVDQADLARFGARGLIPTTAGTANAQTVTHATPMRALLAGMEVAFRPGASNTGAATLNVDGTGAIAVRTPAGNACIGGEMLSGTLTSAIYDGTNWVLTGLPPIPAPTTTAGVLGEKKPIISTAGGNLVAPAGGVWFCEWWGYSSATFTIALPMTILEVVGGTLLQAGAVNTIYTGTAYRKG